MKNTVISSNGVFSEHLTPSLIEINQLELKFYHELYGSTEITNIEQQIKGVVPHAGVCKKIIEKDGLAWQCSTCGIENTCIICPECYKNSNHEGHDVKPFRQVDGGICDCGDPEAWKIGGMCKLHSEGFTDESFLKPELLPEPIKHKAIPFLDGIMNDLNKFSLELERELGILNEHDPAIINNEFPDIDDLKLQINIRSRVIIHLCELSPIFLHMIAICFRNFSLDFTTLHQCHKRTFDSPSEKSSFEELCSKHKYNPALPTKLNEMHKCSCTYLENYMKILFSLPLSDQVFINNRLFNCLSQDRKLKYFMALSYFANYKEIVQNADDDSSLAHLSVQFICYDNVVEKVLSNDTYLENVFQELTYIFVDLKDYENMPNIQALHYRISVVCCDLRCLIKRKYCSLYYPWLFRFVETLVHFHVIQFTPHEEVLFSECKKIEETLILCFTQMLSVVDFSNHSLCAKLANVLNGALEWVGSNSTFTKGSGHIIILHRCLSIFLINYLSINYWLPKTRTEKDPPLSPLSKQSSDDSIYEPITPTKSYFLLFGKLYGFESYRDSEDFAKKWLSELLESIGNFIISQTNEKMAANHIKVTRTETLHMDFSLAAVLLVLLRRSNDILRWVIKSMYPGQKDVEIIADTIGNTGLNSSVWLGAAKQDIRPLKDLKSLMERTIYTICNWISNDITYSNLMIYLRKNLVFTQEPIDKTKIICDSYFQYSLSRLIIQIYFNKINSNDGLTCQKILDFLPESSRDRKIAELILEKIATHYEDTKENLIKFKIQEEALKLYDPFIEFSAFYDNRNYILAKNCLRKIQNPKQFDFFFGEFMDKYTNFNDKDSYGNDLIPFKSVLREFFAESKLLKDICNFVKQSEPESLSVFMRNCLLKILLSIVEYEKSSIEITNMWYVFKDNFAQILQDNIGETGDLIEISLIEYIKIIETKINEKIELKKHEERILEEKKELEIQKKALDFKKKAKEMQSRVRLEFKKYTNDFIKKNYDLVNSFRSKSKELLNMLTEIHTCAYCLSDLDENEYEFNQFGKITYIQRSTVFGHHLNQVCKSVYVKLFNEEQKFMHVIGKTMGAGISCCGHYIHKKCLEQILYPDSEKPEESIKQNLGKIFLCPACRGCANCICPPFEVLKKSTVSLSHFSENVLPLIKKAMYENVEIKKPDTLFELCCKCISYQVNLVTLHNVKQFDNNKDILFGLIYILKENMKTPDKYSEIITKIEHGLKFLRKDRYMVYKADLNWVFTMIIVGAKIMENSKIFKKIMKELNSKCCAIIKLSIIQIVMRLIYGKYGLCPNFETLNWIFRTPNLTLSQCVKSYENIQDLLLPFLKKMFCLKVLLFNNPGTNESIRTVLHKSDWLDKKYLWDYYFSTLSLKNDFKTFESFNNKNQTSKSEFIHIPNINFKWMFNSWISLLNNFDEIAENENIPTLLPKSLVIYNAMNIPFEFIKLPDTLTKCEAYYASKECKNCHKYKADSAVCLLCGELLCVANDCCRRKGGSGELSYHAKICLGGCGIYLRLKNNRILLIDNSQACNHISPYVNKFGESVDVWKNRDCGMLKYDQRISEDLKNIYLSHGILREIKIIDSKSSSHFTPNDL